LFDSLFEEPESEPINAIFDSLGYDTSLTYYNLGSIFLFGIFWSLFGCFVKIFNKIYKPDSKLKKWIHKQKFFWNSYIRFAQSSYLVILISSAITMRKGLDWSQSAEVLSNIIAIVCFVVCVFFFFFVLVFYCKNYEIATEE